MGKRKAVAAVLAALILIAGMAVLPRGIAGITDLMTNEKPGTASIHTVELSIYSDQADKPGYMLRKLALEHWMTSIPITPEQARMTEEEVLNAALDGMAAYIEAGVFEWFEYSFSAAEPYLGVDTMNKSNNSIFWAVTLTYPYDAYQSLFLHIDDETGKIIYLSYETYGPDQYKYYYPENQHLMMDRFVDAFLRPLNLTLEQLSEYDGLLGYSAEELEVTDDVTYVVYTYEDAQYGTVHIDFQITPRGLFIYIR